MPEERWFDVGWGGHIELTKDLGMRPSATTETTSGVNSLLEILSGCFWHA